MVNLFSLHGWIGAYFTVALPQEIGRSLREKLVLVQNRFGQITQICDRLLMRIAPDRILMVAVVTSARLLFRVLRFIAASFTPVYFAER